MKDLDDMVAELMAMDDSPIPPVDAALDARIDAQLARQWEATTPDPDMILVDPVEAMQQLLLKHEAAHLHEVEDPELVRVIDEIKSIAFANIADLYEHIAVESIVGVDHEGEAIFSSFERLTVTDITRLPRHVSAAIKSVKVKRMNDGDVIEVVMHDKSTSLDKLMRYHGAYERDNKQQAKGASEVMGLLLSSIGSAGMPTIVDNSA